MSQEAQKLEQNTIQAMQKEIDRATLRRYVSCILPGTTHFRVTQPVGPRGGWQALVSIRPDLNAAARYCATFRTWSYVKAI
jgi:argininosuccinate lyase